MKMFFLGTEVSDFFSSPECLTNIREVGTDCYWGEQEQADLLLQNNLRRFDLNVAAGLLSSI